VTRVLLTLVLAALATPSPAPIEAVVGREPNLWGVVAVDVDSGRVVYEHNAAVPMVPASNQKILTTAAVLDALGPQWTARTSLYATVEPEDGVVVGDLVLYGRGDPNLSGRFSATDDALEPMRQLAAQLRERGVVRVTGALVADASYLSGPPHGSGWAWEDLQWYFGAEVSALSFNDNLALVRVRPGGAPGLPCEVTVEPDVGYVEVDNRTATTAGGPSRIAVHRAIDGRVVEVSGSLAASHRGWSGGVAVHDPPRYAAAAMRRALAAAGVEVAGPTLKLGAGMQRPERLAPDRLVELAAIESRPLSELIREVNKHSQNLHAELLLRVAGRERGPSDLPSDEAGLAVVSAFLARAGAPLEGGALFDGSGLSRLNRVAPATLAAVARAMATHPSGPFFVDSLPVAGFDGTLKGRLGGMVIRAKTGSLRTAKSLSGYVTTAKGGRLAFSILYNSERGTGGANGQIDRVAVALAASP
jgi:D-alanyl-D-alanine carboxypeptidase/D-alanyl-D-alanine-endopeptidase (penicillin-binding protein 4)